MTAMRRHAAHPVVTALSIATILGGLTACVTTDFSALVAADGAATLELYPMASSQNTLRCLLIDIDGMDVRQRHSARLTAKYLLPSGSHTYSFSCEELIGSVPVGGFGFAFVLDLLADAEYGLMGEVVRNDKACIIVQRTDGQAAEQNTALARFCPRADDQ